jgi:carboxymethylenebutenolidase
VTIHLYEGEDHGFNCDMRAQFNAEAAARALERTLASFGEKLG